MFGRERRVVEVTGDERHVRVGGARLGDRRLGQIHPRRPSPVRKVRRKPARAAPEIEDLGIGESQRFENREDRVAPSPLVVVGESLPVPALIPVTPLRFEGRQR